MTEDEVKDYCSNLIEDLSDFKNQYRIIYQISNTITETLNNKGTIFFCGNGGSAGDSQHIAAEFTGRFLKERRSLPAISLTTNTSVITAIGNDYSYDDIFSRQVSGLMKNNDCLIGISTSGKSKNVINACVEAKKIGAKTISFTGNFDSELSQITDISFKATSKHTPRIQENHIMALHAICDIVERTLFHN